MITKKRKGRKRGTYFLLRLIRSKKPTKTGLTTPGNTPTEEINKEVKAKNKRR
jgi:hypothetical protein